MDTRPAMPGIAQAAASIESAPAREGSTHAQVLRLPTFTPPPLPRFGIDRGDGRAGQGALRRTVTRDEPRPAVVATTTAPTPAPGVPEPLTEAFTQAPAVLDLAELRAVVDAPARSEDPPAASAPTKQPPAARPAAGAAETKPKPARQLSTTVATVQVVATIVLMLAAPLLMLATDKPSALAFAAHGIGALIVMVLATMAMHKGYPLLRGGNRSWPAFRALTVRLAVASLAQGASSMWILWYYHAPEGPGHLFADSAPLVDQLAMQFKIFAGVAALVMFLAAWWSARTVGGERGDLAVRAPVFAIILGWVLMIAAVALGTGITWVASV